MPPQLAPLTSFDVSAIRRQFPALQWQRDGRPAVFFDGPAGSQVPQRVVDAMAHYLTTMNANHGGAFPTSQASDAMLEAAHRAVATFLGSEEPDLVAFGANMTTLTFGLSRALARTWKPGDEILVSRLDHDANVTPWVLAARDAGATVRHIEIHRDDCTLDLDDLRSKVSSRTRLVAFGGASNAVGTVNPIAEIVRLVHAAGGLVFLDAVHYAPHRLMDVTAWDCDFAVCSAYKFFGPHVGVLWGKRKWLESLPAYKLRPAPDDLPGRWMTGTQSHEGIAGVLAAVEYLADLGRSCESSADCRTAIVTAMQAIAAYERGLAEALLAGLATLPNVRIWGITDPARLGERVPTVGITHSRLKPQQIAERLAERGIFVWHGNFYALPLTEALDLEPDGLVRIGLLHYNTREEIERLIVALKEI